MRNFRVKTKTKQILNYYNFFTITFIAKHFGAATFKFLFRDPKNIKKSNLKTPSKPFPKITC